MFSGASDDKCISDVDAVCLLPLAVGPLHGGPACVLCPVADCVAGGPVFMLAVTADSGSWPALPGSRVEEHAGAPHAGVHPSATLLAEEEGAGGGHLVTEEDVEAVSPPLLQLIRLLFPGLRYSWLSFPVNSITLSFLRSLTQDDDASLEEDAKDADDDILSSGCSKALIISFTHMAVPL